MYCCILYLAVLINLAMTATLRLRPMVKIANSQNAKVYRNAPIPSQVQVKPKEKPLCGPVPFPGFSCEETTTCKPNLDVRNGPHVVVLHKPPNMCEANHTTRMPTPATVQMAQRYRQFLQGGNAFITTSTMAAFYGGTTPEDPKPPEIALCGGIAKCSIHEWRRWIQDMYLKKP